MEDIPVIDIPIIREWITRFPSSEQFLEGITVSIPYHIRALSKSNAECLAKLTFFNFTDELRFKSEMRPQLSTIRWVDNLHTCKSFAIAVLTNIGDKLSEFARDAIFYSYGAMHHTYPDFWIAIAASCTEYTGPIPTEIFPLEPVSEPWLMGLLYGCEDSLEKNANRAFTIMEQERSNPYLSFLRTNNYIPTVATILAYSGITQEPKDDFWKGLVMTCYL